MKAFARSAFISLALATLACAQDAVRQARLLEQSGDALGARALLQRAARNNAGNAEVVLSYAEFLDRYHDPETRDTYDKALKLLQGQKQADAARRLVLLDLIEGDRATALRHFEIYRAAGGKDWPSGLPPEKMPPPVNTIELPGPLRSFSRMTALAPETEALDLLPALARNVVTSGYQASSSGESLEPTEYMKLIVRYLSQARELGKLAGEKKGIRIETCDSAQTGELLKILGYRMRGGCGSDVALETVNASRAFLTADSGFPISELEQALRTNRPFEYAYHPARVPVLYGADYWLSAKEKQSGEFIDIFLSDPVLCRTYLGMTKLDRETADQLKSAVPLARLKAFAHVLDFFGSMFQIRDGKVMVPGGARSAGAWAEMAGVSPDQGAAFLDKLIAKDDGWMASYFDALARVNGPAQDYLTEPARMKRLYAAIRGRVTSPGPARPVFRSNTDLMLLTTRLRLDADGKPHVPGNLDIWRNLFVNHPHGRYDSKLSRSASGWKEPDDLIEALFGMCRKLVDNEPLKIYMALSDLDRFREKPLEAATVDRLAREYRFYGAQYPVLAESPVLGDRTILQFLDFAKESSKIGDSQFRADLAGTVQGLAGLWQIFCRQGSIPLSQADASLSGILTPFTQVHGNRELFDAGMSGVRLLLKATGDTQSAGPQDRLMVLLAGTSSTSDSETQAQVIQDMIRVFEAQRLISLNALSELADDLEGLSRGGKLNTALVNRVSARIAEIPAPRAGLTAVEKNTLSFGYWAERHIDTERHGNLKAAVERAAGDPAKLKDVRGLLAPHLRDALVGLNYVHYAPPAAQLLLTNPIFVRSHDFIGLPGTNQTWKFTELLGSGWPTSAGGRLIGSLAGLPYALAEAEQNFLVPVREQALIWGDLVPQLLLSAKIPRWWDVTRAQLHWVELHMRYAETMLAEAGLDPRVRERVVTILGHQAVPARAAKVDDLLGQGHVRAALESVTPSELFLIARESAAAGGDVLPGLAAEMRRLQQSAPDNVNYETISRAFGTPKPTLTNSYRPELLYLRTFPTLMGYSSRIMAESWESTILYWAAVADEVHVPPTQLNVLIPVWTEQTVERIFATHLEDWPALLRSLRIVGEDVRLKLRTQMDTEQKASLQ